VCGTGASGHQALDDDRVDDRVAVDHFAQGADEVVDIAEPVLEQIGQAGCAVAEQGEGIGLVGVLGQHHDSGAGVLAPDVVCGLDAFQMVTGRHPDVGQDRVRTEPAYRIAELVGGDRKDEAE
jgi:hypothetical protein